MSRHPDEFLVPPEAIDFIEKKEEEEGLPLAKVEIIEHFLEWLSLQPPSEQVSFLREALKK